MSSSFYYIAKTYAKHFVYMITFITATLICWHYIHFVDEKYEASKI